MCTRSCQSVSIHAIHSYGNATNRHSENKSSGAVATVNDRSCSSQPTWPTRSGIGTCITAYAGARVDGAETNHIETANPGLMHPQDARWGNEVGR